MLRMLIVEDERWEREGLVDFLDWEALGIDRVDVACDGLEGLNAARLLSPDIIVTDIQMPRMNGIEMANLIRQEQPDTQIIILTGYGEFEFARGALRIGAAEYLLKPIEEDAMLEVMQKVVSWCVDHKRKKQEEAKLRQEWESGRNQSAAQALAGLIMGQHDESLPGQLQSFFEQQGSSLKPFSIWAVRSERQSRQTAGSLEDVASRVLARPVLAQVMEGNGLSASAVLVPLGDHELSAQERLARLLLDALASEASDPYIGLGNPRNEVANMSQCYREACHSLKFAWFYGRSGICQPDTEEGERRKFNDQISILMMQEQEYAKLIKANVAETNLAAAEKSLESLFALFRELPGAGSNYIVAKLSTLMADLLQLASLHENDRIQTLSARERLADMYDDMKTCVAAAIDQLNDKRTRKDDYVVAKVLRLIDERYNRTDLGIAYLAEEVFVSPNHLGVIFKKATGKTLNEYIREYRINRAELLLRTTKQRVAAIAEQIGIPNTSYFVTLFKQVYGMTPGEYQEVMLRG